MAKFAESTVIVSTIDQSIDLLILMLVSGTTHLFRVLETYNDCGPIETTDHGLYTSFEEAMEVYSSEVSRHTARMVQDIADRSAQEASEDTKTIGDLIQELKEVS